mmetsp:Transcript_41153/g.106528  ORF Transcript_41153/g.106528 Transcript_41153/m.106528 type:complete len:408 (-) Transcript_41153:866-2089(-)
MGATSPAVGRAPARGRRGGKPAMMRGFRVSLAELRGRLAEPGLWLLATATAAAYLLATAGSWAAGVWHLTQAWLALELAFLAYQYWQYRMHNRVGSHPVPHHEPDDTFTQFLALKDHLDIRPFLTGWFHGADFEEIKRGNVEELICYGFYYKQWEEVAGTEVEERLAQHVREVEAAFGICFDDGYNPSLRFMSHLWDPLNVTVRPLLFYGATEAVGLLSHAVLLASGFRRHSHSHVGAAHYWVRRAEAGAGAGLADGSKPLVFMHGIGFGLLPYMPFLRKLWRAFPSRTLILAEYRHVTMRLCWSSPHVDEAVYELAGLLEEQGHGQACIMGHSYGTLVMTRFMQLCPAMVGAAVMVDPVSLMVLHPKLLNNFVYRPTRLVTRENMRQVTSCGRRQTRSFPGVCFNF